jgi:2-phospho-L-lactate guanylyltransferase
MLTDVLGALAAVPRIDLRAVVSPDSEVLALVQSLGARPLAEPATVRGLNQALTYAARTFSANGVEALLVMPLDVPALTPAEVEALLEALPAQGEGVALCPSVARGTGALALRPPQAIPFRFGRDSFLAHRREANVRGLPLRVLRIPSLALDIDGPDDLLGLLSQPPEEPARAAATRRLLETLEVDRRLTPAARR